MPSPKVATYDLQPAMSAAGVTDALVEAVESDRFDLVIANLANPDMVGSHRGLGGDGGGLRGRGRLHRPHRRRRSSSGTRHPAPRAARAPCWPSRRTTATRT